MQFSVLCTQMFDCMCLHTSCVESKEGITSFGTRAGNDCELPCGDWEPNLGSLKAQAVLLTAKPPLHPFHLPLCPPLGWLLVNAKSWPRSACSALISRPSLSHTCMQIWSCWLPRMTAVFCYPSVVCDLGSSYFRNIHCPPILRSYKKGTMYNLPGTFDFCRVLCHGNHSVMKGLILHMYI